MNELELGGDGWDGRLEPQCFIIIIWLPLTPHYHCFITCRRRLSSFVINLGRLETDLPFYRYRYHGHCPKRESLQEGQGRDGAGRGVMSTVTVSPGYKGTRGNYQYHRGGVAVAGNWGGIVWEAGQVSVCRLPRACSCLDHWICLSEGIWSRHALPTVPVCSCSVSTVLGGTVAWD